MFRKKKAEEEAPFAVTVSQTTYTEYRKGKLSVEKRKYPHRTYYTIRVVGEYGDVDIPMDELENLKELLSEVE